MIKVTIAQLNFWVGDIERNLKMMLDAIQQAKVAEQSDLIVFPELALSGYPPEDLLFRPELHDRIHIALEKIALEADGIDVLLGYPQQISFADKPSSLTPLPSPPSRGQALGEGSPIDYKLYNAAIWFRHQKILTTYQKQELPNYGVFDEERYFSRGDKNCIVDLKGALIGVLICEDIWYPEPVAACAAEGAQLIICLNASPFDLHKKQEREGIILQRIAEQKVPILYAHCVGGQDELIFDGGSMLFDKTGALCQSAPVFKETLVTFSLEDHHQLTPQKGIIAPVLSRVESAYQALLLGVRDYVYKNGFSHVLLGLSGGIDSALTLAIAVDALGAEHVKGVLMPSRYTSALSKEGAIQEANILRVKYEEISIEPTFQAFLQILETPFANYTPDITEENLQARCRGMILMALSNKTGALVLTTGNKSEMGLGYSTLYGDTAGGLDVLKDVSKTLVYELAHYRNSQEKVIPQAVLERAPSAELAPNQRDEDTLPPYKMLDQILEYYIERRYSFQQLLEKGFPQSSVEQAITRIHRNEYKRRQAPPGIRITALAFGRDWRYPITSGFLKESRKSFLSR